MARSAKAELLRSITELLMIDDRFVDMGAQLEVYACKCGTDHSQIHDALEHEAVPAEVLPKVYGGRYDRLLRKYVGPPAKTELVKCHRGQVSLLTFDEKGVARVLALGAPGGGKTFAAVIRALLNCLERPNSTGGLVAPTNDRRRILWNEFMALVEPLGWIEYANESKKQIRLRNGCVIDVLAAKKPSAQHGNPLQGRSWDWAVVDESQNVDDDAQTEIDVRGRRAGTKYCVYETATNAQIPQFRIRLEKYKLSPVHRIIRYAGRENPFVEPGYWERLKSLMSEREYREKILVEDLPPEMLLYPRFSFAETIRPRPLNWADVTEQLVMQMFKLPGRRFVVAQDFGVLVNASILLKCYQEPNTGERLWWAVDEITTYRSGADQHAKALVSRYDASSLIVVADPHINSPDTDKSDYNQFKNAGLVIKTGSPAGERIPKKHRVGMVNALLEDATLQKKRRFFIDCDANRTASCPKLVQSFMAMQLGPGGEIEEVRKDHKDMSHWTAALGYGLFRWERVRGNDRIQFIRSGGEGDKNGHPNRLSRQ
jgi:hypothetical protein